MRVTGGLSLSGLLGRVGCINAVAAVWLAQHWDLNMGVYVKRAKLVLALLAVFALGACSTPQEAPEPAPATTTAPASQAAAESTPAAQAAESSMIMCNDPSCDPDGGLFPVDGKYEFTSDSGTTGAFQFDSKPDAKIESLRKAVDANQVHYMVVDVDNRASMEHATIYTVNAYDTDGKKYEYKTVEDALEEWSDTVDGDDNAAIDLRNKFTDAINGNKLSLDPSEAGTVILTYEGDLPNDGFTRVSLEVNGAGEETDAYLEGQPLPADDFPESFDSVGDCMQTFAEVNSEVSGESVDSLLEDPELQDLCEDILDDQEGDW